MAVRAETATVGHRLGQFVGRARRRPSPIIIPATVLVLFVVAGIFAPLVAPHSPTDVNLAVRFQPPLWQTGGSLDYPLGTDSLGRDILSRLLYGARVSLAFAVCATLIGATLGTVLGLISGYFGSWTDILIMRVVELKIAIPTTLLAIAVTVALGPSFLTLLLIISLLFWPFYARLVRGQTLSIKQRDFVALAKISGCSATRILRRHILPEVVPTVVVIATLQVGGIILLEAALSFLGVGIPPPNPTWGGMVSDGRPYLGISWWIATLPGIAISGVVLCANLLGDWLRDKLDPRLRQI